METNRVTGRFDPETDYRFAYVSGGVFLSNRFNLKIEYIQNRYELEGVLEETTLKGTWVKMDGSEQGEWTARRDPYYRLRLPADNAVPLYAWRPSETDPWAYTLDPKEFSIHERRVLCKVWPGKVEAGEGVTE